MSVVDFFIYYVPYAALKYHSDSDMPKFNGIFMLLAVALTNVLSLYFYSATLFDWSTGVFSDNPLVNKYVIAPVILGAIGLVMYAVYSVNRNSYAKKNMEFDSLSILEKRRFTRLFWVFVIGSVLIFVSSVTTPLWLS